MKTANHSNRGMGLENDINLTNSYYLEKDIAVIYKKPTPIKVTKVSYDCIGNKRVKDAFYEKPSTTDYNGLYKGKYIDFEAKEIKNSNIFPIINIHKHQIEHLSRINKHGGIAFIIVRFCNNNTTYLLEINKLISFIDNNKRKSIPIEYFEDCGYIIKESYIPRLNYIKIIDNIISKENL
ncbi:MAG TPA: Holliday junction resolvase RecU [Bacilli bacterium]|nr:Holliday junction resolvase RecU [Bacilli bacterium]